MPGSTRVAEPLGPPPPGALRLQFDLAMVDACFDFTTGHGKPLPVRPGALQHHAE